MKSLKNELLNRTCKLTFDLGHLSKWQIRNLIYADRRDKTRVQMPAKMFPHLKLICWLFMGPTLVLTQSKETVS
jgi:hypothetical protein